MRKAIKVFCVFLVLLTLFSSAAFAGITNAETPVTSDEAELKWSLKLGTNYRNAPSTPAVYGDFVYTMSAKKLYKINTENGETVQTTEMVNTPSFGYTPPLAEKGKIFCPVEDGTVQAFDTETMQSLWVYSDALGGQALSPVVYDDGKIYTGFWNDEELEANYICLDADNGSLIWSYTHKGGFYWSKPVFSGNYIVLGGDNGSGNDSSAGKIMLLNKLTGETVYTVEINGDVRSGITLQGGYLYFVTKAGYIYKACVTADGKISIIKSQKLDGASTSTPVIYNNKVYVGVQSSSFNGSLCILNAETLETINTVPMKGYPQSEVLITTAYDNVYIYSTYNAGPGGISVIAERSTAAADLFIPETDSQGYCISPVVATDSGTLIYKNDSGTLFAVGKKEAEKPDKSFVEIIIGLIASIFNLILSMFK